MGQAIAPPIREQRSDYDKMEELLADLFKKEIYEPLVESLGIPAETKLLNSNRSFLIDKIRKGDISYYRGEFSGKFSAKSSMELKSLGAKFSKKRGTFRLDEERLPPDVKQAVQASGNLFDKVIEKIKKKISKILPAEIADSFKGQKLFSDTLYKTDKDIKESLASIKVTPQLSDKAREKIAAEYNHNMQRYIKNWTEKEIIQLRSLVEKESLRGKRYENLVNIIQKRYDVSQNKAKFLARQETGLMMAKFRESRYIDAGSPGYYWATVVGSPKHPVRAMHKDLNGKYFTWDDPPVTNPQNDRNHPGEDYNCRCVPRAVIRF